MMNLTKKIYRFLGSAAFAIVLIATTALLVIAGTFIEARTESHAYAASQIYDSLFFGVLLWGFFANILVSALRRWPFQKQHIPFLITHWGLLMILGGLLVKHYYGVQGTLFILEGSSTNQLMLPGTQALRIDAHDSQQPIYYTISERYKNNNPLLRLEHIYPHSKEKLDTFIKGNWVVIDGIPPFPVDHPVQVDKAGTLWTICGYKDANFKEVFSNHYSERTTIMLSDKKSGKDIFRGSLKNAISEPLEFEGHPITFQLNADWESSPLSLSVAIGSLTKTIYLQGSYPLGGPPGKIPLNVELTTQPSLLIFQNEDTTNVIAIGSYGDVDAKFFDSKTSPPLYSYDHGFGGYGAQTILSLLDESKEELEKKQISLLKQELQDSRQPLEQLVPPIRLLNETCQQLHVDFANVCVDFLSAWAKEGSWMYSSNTLLSKESTKVFAHIDWKKVPALDLNTCMWATHLLANLQNESEAKDIVATLNLNGWPFAKDLSLENDKELVLGKFLDQLQLVAGELPLFPHPAKYTPQENARLLSTYCRIHHIHLDAIIPPFWESPRKAEIVLETPLTASQKLLAPTTKVEENTPLAIFTLDAGPNPQTLALSYDRYAQGMKWPSRNGRYLFRFQPLFQDIPYDVRLRQARQVNYPGTSQSYSYESDLIITDQETEQATEATISMNQVYETWDGYRFYLSSLTPSDESAAKRVQIVVNRDPAKYFLTYPGAFVLSMGIFLLFWGKSLRKS